MKLSRIINNERRWTQNALARNKNGESLDLDYINRDNVQQVKQLESFSLHGALTWFIPYERQKDERDKTRVKIRKAIQQYTGKDISIREFNDSTTTKYEDIRAVLRIAEDIKSIKPEKEID